MKKNTGSPWAERERREARELWEEIFPEDSVSFLNYYDEWKVPGNRIRGRHRHGELVSMIQWNPYRLWMRGRLADSYYLIAVATKERFRHRGYMSGLLRDGLTELENQKIPFVFLMPADKNIYLPFDFRYIYSKIEEEIPLPSRTAETGLRARPLTPEEYGEVAAFLEEQLEARREVFPFRDAPYLARTQAECRSEGGDLEGVYDGDALVGLFSWWGEVKAEIRELVTAPEWEQGEKREILLDTLRGRFAGRRSLSVITTGWLGTEKPIIMGRVVHLPSFLSVCRSETPVTLRLSVDDPLLPGNRGVFRWTLGPEDSVLERTTGEPEAEMGIADLISWVLGGASPEELASCRLTPEGQGKLRKIRVPQGTFFNEIV